MILAAPAVLQPITAASPTPPSPHTADVDPGFTLRRKAIEKGIAMSKDIEHLHRPPRLDRKILALSFRQISISTYSPTVRRKLL